MRKIKVAFIIDNLEVSHHIYDLINFVSKNDHFDIPILIHGHKYKKSNLSLIKVDPRG